ncbi:hypothetical protein D3C87_22620 [compost metagenome]
MKKGGIKPPSVICLLACFLFLRQKDFRLYLDNLDSCLNLNYPNLFLDLNFVLPL